MSQHFLFLSFFSNLPNLWVSKWVLIVSQIRQFLQKNLFIHLPKSHQSLLKGLIFGGVDTMDQQTRHFFKVIGMLHVVSASGFNVSLVVSLVKKVLKIWPLSLLEKSRFCQTMIVCFFIFFYAMLSDGSWSIWRSSVMTALRLMVKKIFFKQLKPIIALVFSCLILFLVDPLVLESVGFQLSVAATLGVVMVYPSLCFVGQLFFPPNTKAAQMFKQFTLKQKIISFFKQVILESFGVSLAVQLTTLPLIWLYFGQLSLLSLVTNTLLVWLTPILTSLGIILLFMNSFYIFFMADSSLAGPNLGSLLLIIMAKLVELSVNLFLSAVSFFGQFETSFVTVKKLSWPQVLCWWLGVGMLVIISNYWHRKKCYQNQIKYWLS